MEEIRLPASELPPLRANDADTPALAHASADSDDPPTNDEGPVAPVSPEEKEERRRLVRKIMRYRSLFSAELTDLDLERLGDRGLDELRDLARDVEFLVSTRRSAKAVRGMFLGGMTVLEAGGPFVGLQLQGLTNVCAHQEELLQTVDEAAVKYESLIEVDPVARIAIHVAQLCLALDGHNRARAAVAAADLPGPSESADAWVGACPKAQPEPAPPEPAQQPGLNKTAGEFADL